MKFQNYYQIMEVASNASPEEIKQAYHRLAHKFHPDISHEPDAEQKFKEINEAYEVLKDPQKRTAYNASFKIIIPYTYAWFLAKKDTWMRTNAQMRAKKAAGVRAKLLGRNKKDIGGATYVRGQTIRDNNVKSTSKFPFLLIGAFVLILSAIIIAIFAVKHVSPRQNPQQIMTAILQGDETAIKTLESSDIETQKQILEGKQVKPAVVRFYLQRPGSPIFTQLETYDDTIESDILTNDEVYRTLIAHYNHKINSEIDSHHFDKALLLLDTLKKKYPYSQELSDKYQQITQLKQQYLAKSTQPKTACSDQMLIPGLEKTPCLAEAPHKTESVSIESTLPNDPNLSAKYAEQLKQALTENHYERAEKLLLDWQKQLPEPSKQRDTLRQLLNLHQQKNNIIADLTSHDKDKIINRLNQLMPYPELQQELFDRPEIQNGLLDYYLNEALGLMTTKEGEVNVHPNRISQLTQILAVVREASPQTKPLPSTPQDIPQTEPIPSTPQDLDSTSQPTPVEDSEIANLLQECHQHYEAKRLTTGKPGTALNCYQTVLKQEPNNQEALEGLKILENTYQAWAESALRQNQLDHTAIYLVGLKKVAPDSPVLAPLQLRLWEARATQKKQSTTSQQPNTCDECNCSDLFKQLSMGIKPLTPAQKEFFQTQCH